MSIRTGIAVLSLSTLALGACASDDPCDPTAPQSICTIAGTGLKEATDASGVPALETNLYVPQDMAVSPEGELWVLDFNNYYVKRIDAEGLTYNMVGNGLVGNAPDYHGDPVPAALAPFNHTPDLLFHDGYLYLAAWHQSYVKRVNLATMELENFAGTGKRTRYDGDGGPAIEAALDLPSSITIDPDGALVIMDQANQVVRKVDADGNMQPVAGVCIIDELDPCDPGEEPVACPGSSKLTCGDPLTTCCARPDDSESGTCADQPSDAPCTPRFGGDGGSCLEARMSQPFGQKAVPAGRIAYAGANLIFADTDGHRIRMVDAEGTITTIAGDGSPGFAGDLASPAVDARVNGPVDVEVDRLGDIYFADTQNSCIRKIAPRRQQGSDPDYSRGVISTVAGQCNPDPREAGFEGDGGDPLKAKLFFPAGIEMDGSKMYIADSYNNRIRIVNF